jgi:hypothetical protein
VKLHTALVAQGIVIGLLTLAVTLIWRGRARARADLTALVHNTADAMLATTGLELRLRLREVRFVLARLDCRIQPRWIQEMVAAVCRLGPLDRIHERVPDHLPPLRQHGRARAEVSPPSVRMGGDR